MADQFKRIKVSSPVGIAVYPKVTTPDTKFNADGVYSCRLRVAADKAAPFMAKIDAAYDENLEATKASLKEAVEKAEGADKGKAKKALASFKPADKPYKMALDAEGEETGEVEFKFAKRASYEAKKGPKAGQKVHTKAPLFDARGVAITKAPEIWGGTVARVSFTASPYFIPGTGAAGLKLNLDAVQIIELRQSGGRDATGYGFGKEEDGYAHSDAQDEGAESAQDGGADQEQASGGTPDF
jgi:hypothetical protein